MNKQVCPLYGTIGGDIISLCYEQHFATLNIP